MAERQRFDARHGFPGVAPPALHHHQQVEGLEAEAVVASEVEPGIFHEAFQFAGQQQFREDIAVVMSRFVRAPVAHGQRHVGLAGSGGRLFQP